MTDKDTQFQEYFMIDHQFSINVTPFGETDPAPTMASLESEIPEAFKMASELTQLDQAALRPLRELGDSAVMLTDYLTTQSRKINLMMGYILSQLDNEAQREQCQRFGGSGLVFTTKNHYQLGQLLRLKLFLNEIAAAVYCYGEIINVVDNPEGTFTISVVYHTLREDDREVIVKASLYEQTKQLRQLSLTRNKDN